MEIDKIITGLTYPFLNIYFLIAILILLYITIMCNIIKYPTYKRVCKILDQEPTPKGFIINGIYDYFQVSTIIFIAFAGFAALPSL